MLNWSYLGYKLTLGAGGLAMVAVMAQLWREVVPAWAAFAIALGPLAIFVFADHQDLPPRAVAIAHIAASLWYFVVAVGLFIAMLSSRQPLPQGWPVYPLFAALGGLPCGIVLARWMRRGYPPRGSQTGGVETTGGKGRFGSPTTRGDRAANQPAEPGTVGRGRPAQER